MTMKNLFKIILAVVIISVQVSAQDNSLQIPLNFQKAYAKHTRSFDGKPGPDYWQNKSDYNIKAELNPDTSKLSGEETVIYYNDSPDTLKQIILRLYPDFYRRGNMRDMEIDKDALTDGMQIEKLIVDGSEMKFDSGKGSPRREVTNLFVPLLNPLPPNSKLKIAAQWYFTIPNKSQIRMGAYDSASFFVAYWYPQVAVYDDIDGWDILNYTGRTEMYNDFNNYDVEVSVPKGFLLWSTGVLQNPEKVYAKNILEKYNKAHQSNEIVNIVTKEDLANGTTSVNKKLVYKIKAEYVPDFVFATSDHYLWDASELTVDKSTGREAFISAAYNKTTNDFSTVAEVARKSIESFSTRLPGVPYPYPCMTIFNGRGGMEFPMMCNNSAVKELWATVHLTSHEISHTYFPFYMGINERKYAWMDEGWATMLPFDFQTENAPGYDPRSRNALSYSEFAGYDNDLPLMTPSYELRDPAYRTASYRRPGAAYDFLQKFLGDDLFKKALHEYMKRWNGKHPTPYDFFFTFDNVTGEDLSWYWKPWFFENKYPDLAFADVETTSDKVNLTVLNIGGLPLPIIVTAYYGDGTNETVIDQTARIWKDGKNEISLSFSPKKKILFIQLGTSQIPDVNKLNNRRDINQ